MLTNTTFIPTREAKKIYSIGHFAFRVSSINTSCSIPYSRKERRNNVITGQYEYHADLLIAGGGMGG